MIEGLLGSHRSEFVPWSGAKRTARRSQDQTGHLLPVARAQTLMDAVVFAVDWQQFRAVIAYRIHHQLTARNQYFLVCEAYTLAATNGFVCGFQPLHTDDGRNHNVHLSRR